MPDPTALIPLTASRPVRLVAFSESKQRAALCGLGAIVLLAMGFLTAGLPVISMCMLALAGVSSFVFGSTAELARDALNRRVAPEEILSGEVRALYRSVLVGFADVERALGEAPRLAASLAQVVERCRAAVRLSGRIALLANPIQRYLDAHDAALVRTALDRLRARAQVTRDGVAITALHHAAATRTRQLAMVEQIAAKRDQIAARLELVAAALEAFAVTIVKLHTLEEEHVVMAGESMADQLDGIHEDLEVLETALDPDLESELEA